MLGFTTQGFQQEPYYHITSSAHVFSVLSVSLPLDPALEVCVLNNFFLLSLQWPPAAPTLRPHILIPCLLLSRVSPGILLMTVITSNSPSEADGEFELFRCCFSFSGDFSLWKWFPFLLFWVFIGFVLLKGSPGCPSIAIKKHSSVDGLKLQIFIDFHISVKKKTNYQGPASCDPTSYLPASSSVVSQPPQSSSEAGVQPLHSLFRSLSSRQDTGSIGSSMLAAPTEPHHK